MDRRAGRLVTTDPDANPRDTDVDADVDADCEESETGPLRRCVVTRDRLAKERMIRFVVSPDRVLVPDLAGKLPGRGIWLSASRDVIEGPPRGLSGSRPNGKPGDKPASVGPFGSPLSGLLPSGANARDLIRAVARAARGPVAVPPDLVSVLDTALVRRIGDFMGLARRAGQAIAGFEKARDWVRSHPVGLVMQAADGSMAERSRFRSVLLASVPVLTPLTGAELGRVFGHDTVVHVAVARGRLAEAMILDASRLAGLRGSSDWAANDPPETVGDEPPERARDTNPPAAERRITPHEAV